MAEERDALRGQRLALGPHYDADGDQIEVHIERVNHYGQWLGHAVTVYRAEDDGRVVGFEVGNVRHLTREAAPWRRFRRWLRDKFARPRPFSGLVAELGAEDAT